MNNKNNNKTFRALMAYLNPIGPIGANVDMWRDGIEYFPSSWTSQNTMKFEILQLFENFIRNLISFYGEELYNRTNKQEPVYWVDVTIDPRSREIMLTPKYYVYKESKDNKTFDWRELRNYYIISRFMENHNIEELTIEYNGHEGNFDLTITYNNKEMNGSENRYFSYETRMMISEILENDDWNDDAGGHGLLKLYDKDNYGYLDHVWVEKNVANGKPIILTEEDFK